jgi:hypothetical protein
LHEIKTPFANNREADNMSDSSIEHLTDYSCINDEDDTSNISAPGLLGEVIPDTVVVTAIPELHLTLKRIQVINSLFRHPPQTTTCDEGGTFNALSEMRGAIIELIDRKWDDGAYVVARMARQGVSPEDVCAHLDRVFTCIEETFLVVVRVVFMRMAGLAETLDTTVLCDEEQLNRQVISDMTSEALSDNNIVRKCRGLDTGVPVGLLYARIIWYRVCKANYAVILKQWQQGHYFACALD